MVASLREEIIYHIRSRDAHNSTDKISAISSTGQHVSTVIPSRPSCSLARTSPRSLASGTASSTPSRPAAAPASSSTWPRAETQSDCPSGFLTSSSSGHGKAHLLILKAKCTYFGCSLSLSVLFLFIFSVSKIPLGDIEVLRPENANSLRYPGFYLN